MPEIDDAVKLLTEPANVSRLGATGPQERFAVNSNRVLRGLKQAGAGKAQARELALQGLAKLEGGVETHSGRAAQRGKGGASEVETWWVPAASVRFEG